MAFLSSEKVTIKRHLGYNSAADANYPFVETFWSIDRVLDDAPPWTVEEAQSILAKLGDIETRLSDALDRLQASRVGTIDLNANETNQLRAELRHWRRELSTLLGVPLARRPGSILVA